MSWDIVVQDFGDYKTIKDIPRDFQPQPIGPLEDVRATIKRVCPTVSFDDAGRGLLRGDGYSIEFILSEDDPCKSFTLQVRGGDASTPVIACLLNELEVRGLECAGGEFFEDAVAPESLNKWRAYRDQVLGEK